MAVKVPDVLIAYANNITFHKKTLDWKMTKTHFLFFFVLSQDNTFVYLFLIFLVSYTTLLLFAYSCLHFLPTTPPHPIQTHLPPQLPPSWGPNSV